VVAVTTTFPTDLVLHHRYADGLRDRSGHGNHGYSEAPPGEGHSGPGGALAFDGVRARVYVPPSPSLTRPGPVRADVVARASELGHRRTLVEGYLSFALTAEHDGSLSAGVFADGTWTAVRSAPGVVRLDTWLEASFLLTRDGLLALVLDGEVIAQVYRPLGALDGVGWPFGVSVGAWPDDEQRVWSGAIEEVRIWKG
jgi:hypothetical protein